MLTADRVSFAYRAGAPLVVDDVSLAIAPGELVGILGPNGSGKTTLLKMLGGTLTPSAGEIQFDGGRSTSWQRRELARRIALVPQETHAPFDFTVLDIVLMGRFPHLGAFALEGPADLAIARAGARVHRHRGVRRRGRSPRSAAARNSASSSPARWRRAPSCCCSTSRPPRSISAISSTSSCCSPR